MNNVLVDLFSDYEPESEDLEKDYKIFWRGEEYEGSGIHVLLKALYREQLRRYDSGEEELVDPVVIIFDTGEVCSFFVSEIVDKIDKKCYSRIRFIRNWRTNSLLKYPWKIEELIVNEAVDVICAE